MATRKTKEDRKKHEPRPKCKSWGAAMRRKFSRAKEDHMRKTRTLVQHKMQMRLTCTCQNAMRSNSRSQDKQPEHAEEANIDAMKEKLRVKLEFWQSLLDSGVISEDEYIAGRKKVLDQFV